MKTSIHNWLLSISAIITLLAISNVLGSCSSAEETILKQPYLSQLNNTECITEALQSRAEESNCSFEMTFEGSVAECKFTSLDYPCDFGKVNIKVLYEDGVLTIVEFPSSDEADCRCETDATFTIINAPEKDFILKIYHGDTTGKYNKDSPRYSGTINVKDLSINIPYDIWEPECHPNRDWRDIENFLRLLKVATTHLHASRANAPNMMMSWNFLFRNWTRWKPRKCIDPSRPGVALYVIRKGRTYGKVHEVHGLKRLHG